jgi:dihydrofolate reductase
MKMIVACCKNMGIGYKNKIPWYLPPDLKYFKKLTSKNKDSTLIMGKNTWVSLKKKPLPNRDNIILSSTIKQSEVNQYDNAFVFSNTSDLEHHIAEKKGPVWIIGGELIYKQFIYHENLTDIYLTNILEDFKVDTYFPKIPTNFNLKYNTRVKNYDNLFYTYSRYIKDI